MLINYMFKDERPWNLCSLVTITQISNSNLSVFCKNFWVEIGESRALSRDFSAETLIPRLSDSCTFEWRDPTVQLQCCSLGGTESYCYLVTAIVHKPTIFIRNNCASFVLIMILLWFSRYSRRAVFVYDLVHSKSKGCWSMSSLYKDSGLKKLYLCIK